MVKDGMVYLPKGTTLKVELVVPDAPWDGKTLQWADNTTHDVTLEEFDHFLEFGCGLFPKALKRGLKQHYPDMKSE